MKKHSGYRNVPAGSNFNPNTRGAMVAVSLEDMAIRGSRTQRRWALAELRKLAREKTRQVQRNARIGDVC